MGLKYRKVSARGGVAVYGIHTYPGNPPMGQPLETEVRLTSLDKLIQYGLKYLNVKNMTTKLLKKIQVNIL